MKANELKALMTRCHDQTDLPTDAMVRAGSIAMLEAMYGWDGLGLGIQTEAEETAKDIWHAMLTALRKDGLYHPADAEEG